MQNKDNCDTIKNKITDDFKGKASKSTGEKHLNEHTIDKRPFLITLSTLAATIIFIITGTWSLASMKIAQDSTNYDHNKRLVTAERDTEILKDRLSTQEMSLIEIKIDLKYLIQLQEEMKENAKNERR